jgi:FAD:protein FMN transferase
VALFRRREVFRSHHEPVLGTVLTTRITAPSRKHAHAAEARLLAEIDRLEDIFSAFRPNSELSRWKRGETHDISRELTGLLQVAAMWQRASRGAFNPAVGVLSDRWKQAEAEGHIPDPQEAQHLADTIRTAPFTADGHRTGDCSGLNFNALAKGVIVDIATQMVFGGAVQDILVNIGGDLRHHGRDPVRVGVEDPKRAYDNIPPLTAVEIVGQGMATSGLARRGYRIDGRWFSHVIDPRSGWPVDVVTSASVIATDTGTADVVATVLSVLAPQAGMAWLHELQQLGPHQLGVDPATIGPIACCIIDQAGVLHTNAAWDAVSRPTGT